MHTYRSAGVSQSPPNPFADRPPSHSKPILLRLYSASQFYDRSHTRTHKTVTLTFRRPLLIFGAYWQKRQDADMRLDTMCCFAIRALS